MNQRHTWLRRISAGAMLSLSTFGMAAEKEGDGVELPSPIPAVKSAPAPGTPYAGPAAYPIDLATAIRLADANNPAVGVAQAKVREALARYDQAKLLMLPNLIGGVTYQHHDGQIQNARGDVFTTSRTSLYNGAAVGFRFDSADALFLPLVAERLTAAEVAKARAVTNNIQLDAALAYQDLLQTHGQFAINADTLARAEQMLERAKVADEAGLSKTKGDVNRARTEVSLRRQEREDIRGKMAVASARLARVLLLQPTIALRPVDPNIVPVILVPEQMGLDDLVLTAYRNRPELEANRAQVLAAEARLRQAKYGPLLPKFQVEYGAGAFGGGRNDDIQNYNLRGDFAGQAFWELRNLGLGNLAMIREREAVVDQAQYQVADLQARVGAEVVESAKLAAARFAALEEAQTAVKEAIELYRKLIETSFGMIGPRPQYDALEPLLAIQALNQARVQYLGAVVDFNRAQFRLYTAIGNPSLEALQAAAPQPIDVNPVPPPPDLRRPPAPMR